MDIEKEYPIGSEYLIGKKKIKIVQHTENGLMYSDKSVTISISIENFLAINPILIEETMTEN